MRAREKYKFIAEIAEKLNLPIDLVERVCLHQWTLIKEKIKELPFDKELTEEEFGKLRTSFNLPGLGKIHTTYRAYRAVRNKLLTKKQQQDENSIEESKSEI